MSITEAVRQFVRTYPPLTDNRIYVDCLPDEVGSYSIGVTPCKEWVKRYVDGSGTKQFLFVLTSREAFGEQVRQQLDNLGFYEDFSHWLDRQTAARTLPELGPGRTPLAVEATTSGYAFIPGTETARYQIQCRLTYTQEKEI